MVIIHTDLAVVVHLFEQTGLLLLYMDWITASIIKTNYLPFSKLSTSSSSNECSAERMKYLLEG
jgi:hypothetical protein